MSTRLPRVSLTAHVTLLALFWAPTAMSALDDENIDGFRDDLGDCKNVASCDQVGINRDGSGNLYSPGFENDGLVATPGYSIPSNSSLQPPGPAGVDFAGQSEICSPDARNILIIIADDVGVDKIALYGEHQYQPDTPVIDSLAEQGVLFTNAWSNPVCSSSRATALSGRYGFRTGIGGHNSWGGTEIGLDPTEPNLANQLRQAGYETAAFGKWDSLGCTPVVRPDGSESCVRPSFDDYDLAHPVRSGFDYFAGSLAGAIRSYCNWPKVVAERVGPGMDDIAVTSTTSQNYATWETVEDAISHITGMREPWFAWVAFNAPHTPLHEVPDDPLNCTIPVSRPRPTGVEQYEDMTEKMDQEIGRLLDELDGHCNSLDRTTIVFFGDNGSEASVTTAPFNRRHGKGTPYEGGINVPFIVSGPKTVVAPAASGESSAALVNTTDVFATVMDIAGVTGSTEDSMSLVPYLKYPERPSQRAFAYAEMFDPNGFGPLKDHERAIRGARYKLIHRLGKEPPRGGYPVPVFEFYDLDTDAFEEHNLLVEGFSQDPQEQEQQIEALDELLGELSSLLGTPCPLSLQDGDGDCVQDASDNCTRIPNPSQCDKNQDGYGNRCDGDFDDDGDVDTADVDLLIDGFRTVATSDAPDWSRFQHLDMDCDDALDLDDFHLFNVKYPAWWSWDWLPGPSGLECAGTIPCP